MVEPVTTPLILVLESMPASLLVNALACSPVVVGKPACLPKLQWEMDLGEHIYAKILAWCFCAFH